MRCVRKMKKRMLFLVSLLACMLLINTALAGGGIWDLYLGDALDRPTGPPKTDWYEVAEWEVDYCMAWGGESKSTTASASKIGGETSLISHNRILTIQAEKSEVLPSETTDKLGLNYSYIYEVSWYVMPFKDDDDLNYEVYMLDDYSRAYVIDSGNANFYNPGKGYAINQSEASLSKAVLKVWNEDFNKVLEVPIV